MKKWTALALAAALTFSVAACGGNETQPADSSSDTQTTQEEPSAPAEKPEVKTEDLVLGQMYATDQCEITFNEVYTTNECSVRTGSNSATVKEATEGNTLLVIDASIKNIGTEALSTLGNSGIYEAYVMYDDKYKYENEQYLFVGEYDIAPLAEKTQCLPIEIPNEVASASEPLTLFVTVGGTTYQYAIR